MPTIHGLTGRSHWLLTLIGMSAALGTLPRCKSPVSHVMVDGEQSCSSCHQSEYLKASSPKHVDIISNQCEHCHVNEYWAPARGSNHSWALTGAHTQTPCNDCHTGLSPNYESVPTDCAGCHQGEALAVEQPSHENFSSQCQDCHTTDSWEGASVDHEWPLLGAHAEAECSSCHTGEPPVYEDTPSECLDCHEEDRQDVSEPSHQDFPSTCGDCHSSDAWAPAEFPDHEWPLLGAHAEAECSSCHTGEPPVYSEAETACISCHQEDLDDVVEPPHAEFSQDCSDCHATTSWDGADFLHTEQFPLQGGHAEPACGDCHDFEPAVFDGLSSDCVSCHQQDLADVVEPPHTGFSQDCSDCHGISSWDGADFVHTEQFPLRGGHAEPACGDCHNSEPAVFDGLSSECVSCHQQDFDQSPFPGHDAFPTTCQDCHTISGWTPATGGHPENRFSTRGDHNFACNECHNPALGPNGAGNTDCVGCHEGEHTLARMDREHVGEVRNYPTGGNRSPNFCLQCHQDGRE